MKYNFEFVLIMLSYIICNKIAILKKYDKKMVMNAQILSKTKKDTMVL